MKLDEIAARISAHLKRFEKDPKINVTVGGSSGVRTYYNTSAARCGSRVGVCYVSYQGWTNLKKADAEAYLAWLDAGNVGRHYEALLERDGDPLSLKGRVAPYAPPTDVKLDMPSNTIDEDACEAEDVAAKRTLLHEAARGLRKLAAKYPEMPADGECGEVSRGYYEHLAHRLDVWAAKS